MKLLKKTALAGALGLGLMASSCIGPNNAFNNLNKWNNELTENKWINELAFIPLSPVHLLGLTGDWLIFNSIEFWGFNNPVKPNN